uniref:Uncharacterized protein n=1 Tax=Mus musculus TaxID=10090 RepID=Q3TSH3_MOUSE|nr:unnamed protein product [Mus musculus]
MSSVLPKRSVLNVLCASKAFSAKERRGPSHRVMSICCSP